MVQIIETRAIYTQNGATGKITKEAFTQVKPLQISVRTRVWGQPPDKPLTEPGASLYEVAQVMKRYNLAPRVGKRTNTTPGQLHQNQPKT